MENNLYTVYDKKAEVYSQPFTAINDEVAQRIMQNCVNNPEHNYGLNPEDYQLVRTGKFDDSKGTLIPEEKPILDLITLVKKESK
jgi:hypothetical protein